MVEIRKYNLKKQDAFLKGDLGEIIIKNKVGWAHRTRELSPTWLDGRGFTIGEKFRNFLEEHWFTIDLFKFIVKNNAVVNLELYEVKVRNTYAPGSKLKFPKPNITRNSLSVYKKAIDLGFKVKFAEILLYDNWEYGVFFKDFNPEEFIVHDGGTPYFSKIKR